MQKLALTKRVVTSPLIQTGVVMVEGGMFDDGQFRLVAPAGTHPSILDALDDAVREFDGLMFRQQWAADVILGLPDQPIGGGA